MSNLNYTIIERPMQISEDDPIILALIQTSETGKALEIECPKEDIIKYQQKLRYTLTNMGWKLAYRSNEMGGTIIVWVTPHPTQAAR